MASENSSVRIMRLEFDIQDRDLKKALRNITNFERELKQVDRVQDDLARSSDKFGRELRDAMGRDTLRGAQDLRQELNAIDKAAESASRSVSKISSGGRGLSSFDRAEQFNSKLRGDAGILGDVDTSLQTLGSVSGIGGLQIAGDIFAVSEALPQLQGALSGLPATIKQVASSIGIGGAGLIGAMAALVVAVKVAGDAFQREKEAIEGQIAVEDELIRLRITGTQQQVESRLQEQQTELKIQRERLRQSQEVLEAFETQAEGWQKLAAEVGSALGLGAGASLEAFEERAEDAKNQINEINRSIAGLSKLANEGTLPVEDLGDEIEQTTDAIEEQVSAQKELSNAVQETAKESKKAATAIRGSLNQFFTNGIVQNAGSGRTQSSGFADLTQALINGDITDEEFARRVQERRQQRAQSGTGGGSELGGIRNDISEFQIQTQQEITNFLRESAQEQAEIVRQGEIDKQRILRDSNLRIENSLYERDARTNAQVKEQRDIALDDLKVNLSESLRLQEQAFNNETILIRQSINERHRQLGLELQGIGAVGQAWQQMLAGIVASLHGAIPSSGSFVAPQSTGSANLLGTVTSIVDNRLQQVFT